MSTPQTTSNVDPIPGPDPALQGFLLTALYDAQTGHPYLTLTHTCGPVDVTEGPVTLSNSVDVARGHRCPGGAK